MIKNNGHIIETFDIMSRYGNKCNLLGDEFVSFRKNCFCKRIGSEDIYLGIICKIRASFVILSRICFKTPFISTQLSARERLCSDFKLNRVFVSFFIKFCSQFSHTILCCIHIFDTCIKLIENYFCSEQRILFTSSSKMVDFRQL